MNSAFFFKNVNNLEELKKRTNIKEKSSTNLQNYVIINTVVLSKKDYILLCRNFKINYSFLFKFSSKMKITDDIWNCILVTSDNNTGVLVMNNGYSYPAFTAIYNNE